MLPERFQPAKGMDDFLLFTTVQNLTLFSFMNLLDEQKANQFSGDS